ncbi:MAG: peptidyl-tRNA hydrolase Pth2 [Halobacteriaceae archaeon]
MKQAIAVRADLGMGTGKVAAQVAHASLQADEEAAESDRTAWRSEGQTKVVLRVDSERDLQDLAATAGQYGVPHAMVRDAGRTQLEPGTATALAVGPAPDDQVDRVTGDLPLY